LQVAANPYVVVLGKPETASSRLDLTQAFNSLGTTIAPNSGTADPCCRPVGRRGMKALSPTAYIVPSARGCVCKDAVHRDRNRLATVGVLIAHQSCRPLNTRISP
jgi:hypothetical protein